MRQLVFPCGASYEVRNGEGYPFNGAHVNKDGSIRLVVAGTGLRPPKLPDSPPAPCFFDCLKPGRHSKQQRVYEGVGGNKLGWITTCHGRLHEDGIDVTPPPAGKCPHCEEQRKYEAACRRSARSGEPAPDRGAFAEEEAR